MLTGLHGVVVEVGELEAAIAAHARLLAGMPLVREGNERAVFRSGNARLELRRRSDRGTATATPTPAPDPTGDGLVGLRLAFRPEVGGRLEPGPISSPTVPIELVSDADAHADADADAERGVEHGSGAALEAESPALASGIVALDHVVIATGRPERTRAFLQETLGIRLALDRSFPERGLRLLFFRLGGVTLELAAALAPEAGSSPSRDAFHGLAWRVRGLEATRERLLADGLAVSAIRPGHKAGTRVCSLREPLYGVPTLLIEHPPRPGEGAPSGW